VREALGAYLAVFDEYTLADLVANRAELVVLLETAELNCDPPGKAT
jgi:DNA-binding IscR family transcriptional regulator